MCEPSLGDDFSRYDATVATYGDADVPTLAFGFILAGVVRPPFPSPLPL